MYYGHNDLRDVPNCNSDLRIAILLLNRKIYTSVYIVYTLAIKCYLLEN